MYKSVLLYILLSLSGIDSPEILFAQSPLIKNYPILENDIPSKVFDITQDSLGYLWIGTEKGLYKYNGSYFHKIASTAGFDIRAISLTNNTILLGCNNGNILALSKDSLYEFNTSLHNKTVTLNGLTTNDSNSIWLSTDQGIWSIHHNQLLHTDKQDGLSDNFVYNVEPLYHHQYLIATDKGINLLESSHNKNRISKQWNTSNGLSDNIIKVIRKCHIKNKVWIGTQQAGVQLLDISNNKTHSSKTPWIWGEINDIKYLDDEQILIGSKSGFLLKASLQSDSIIVISQLTKISDAINTIFVSDNKDIWCGTSRGICYIPHSSILLYNLDTFYNIDELAAIATDNNGNLYLAIKNSIYQFNTQTKLAEKIITLDATISSMHIDRYKNIWIATLSGGLYSLDNTKRLKKISLKQIGKSNILNIASTKDRLYIAGLNGIEILEITGKNPVFLKHLDKSSGIGSDYIYNIFVDSKDYIWIASDGGGISRYDHHAVTNLTTPQSEFQKVVFSITEDQDGTIWFADAHYNLHFRKGNKWLPLTAPKQTSDELSILTSLQPHMILSVYNRYIDFYQTNTKKHWQLHLNQWFPKAYFTKTLNCFAQDKAGNLWIPSSEGIIFIASESGNYAPIQKIIINKVNNHHLDISNATTHYQSDENFFNFSFDAIYLGTVHQIYYRYKLSGNNEDWIYTNTTYASFSNLMPGNYKFIVQATTDQDFNHYTQTNYTFSIGKPIWKRWWFIILSLGIIAGIIYLYYNWRMKNVKKIAAIEQEKIYFENEYLRSQVNPHFLFNSLNTLTALIEEHPERAVDYTEKLSGFYRDTINRLDTHLILLSEEIDLLYNYLEILKYRFGNAVIMNLEIPPHISSESNIVPMALQFLVENAIKHNIATQKSPLRIHIKYIKNNTLVVSNSINLKNQPYKPSKLGLKNLEKRYALFTSRTIQYKQEEGNWIVTLPIFKIK